MSAATLPVVLAQPTIAERVAAGAAFLDEHEPGWDRRISPDFLDIGSCARCVLGQLAGRYERGLVEYGLDDDEDQQAYELGFTGYLSGFERLTAEWKRVITERRSAS